MSRWGNRGHAWYSVFSPAGEFINGIPPAYDQKDVKNLRQAPCRTLADMSEDEIRDLEERFGMPVERP